MRTILVDDHPAYLAALAKVVERHAGIEIVGKAYNGQEGLKLAAALKPELVLVDFSMPGMNGAEVVSALKAGPAPPLVIIVSNHDEQEYRDRAFKSGADGYALKSELDEELVPLLKRLIG
jgi:DNA-binding NarL/FixJ family response regulator